MVVVGLNALGQQLHGALEGVLIDDVGHADLVDAGVRRLVEALGRGEHERVAVVVKLLEHEQLELLRVVHGKLGHDVERALRKEKENLLKKQRLQIEQQKKLIGEQDTEIRRLNDVVDEQVVRIAKNGDNIIQLENQVGNLLPKALYSDNVLDSVSCFTTTQIAKELGITAQELNRSLCALHIQYYQSGQYLLYADYAHMGLAKSRTRYSAFLDPKSDGRQEKMGRAYTHTYLVWTERGRKFIHDLAQRYLELCEVYS